MSDLNPTEHAELSTRLRYGVPQAPELTGIASRVESEARTRRRRRQTMAASAAAVMVAAAVTVPRLVSGGGPAPAEPAPAQCVGHRVLDHADFRQGSASWVRACPVPGPGSALPLPTGVLRGQGAASLVAGWQRSATVYSVVPNCGPGSPPSTTVQVGFTDGTVAELEGLDCFTEVSGGQLGLPLPPSTLAASFTAALQHQNDVGYPAGDAQGSPACPKSPTNPAGMDADGASATNLDDTGPVLDLTAVTSLVCLYDHGRLTATRRGQDPQRLLLDSMAEWQAVYPNTRHNLSHDPLYVHPLGPYLVVLGDRTGTRRTFTVSGHFDRIRMYRGDGTVTVLGFADLELLKALGAHPLSQSTRR